MKHSEFTPHAFITLSNWGGIEIMLDHSGDGLYYRFNYGQDNIEQEEIFEAEILYGFEEEEEPEEDTECLPYFLHSGEGGNCKYFLSEAMRINYPNN